MVEASDLATSSGGKGTFTQATIDAFSSAKNAAILVEICLGSLGGTTPIDPPTRDY